MFAITFGVVLPTALIVEVQLASEVSLTATTFEPAAPTTISASSLPVVRIGESGDLILRSAPAFRRESQVGRRSALAAIVAPAAGSPVARSRALIPPAG